MGCMEMKNIKIKKEMLTSVDKLFLTAGNLLNNKKITMNNKHKYKDTSKWLIFTIKDIHLPEN